MNEYLPSSPKSAERPRHSCRDDRRWARRLNAQEPTRPTQCLSLNGRGHCIGGSPAFMPGRMFTERVDALPLLLEQMPRMSLPALCDDPFPTHGNWHGLSLGWVSTIWLSAILSRGDQSLGTRRTLGGHRLWTCEPRRASRRTARFTDDRSKSCCAVCLTTAVGAPLKRPEYQHTCGSMSCPLARLHVDSTRAVPTPP